MRAERFELRSEMPCPVASLEDPTGNRFVTRMESGSPRQPDCDAWRLGMTTTWNVPDRSRCEAVIIVQ